MDNKKKLSYLAGALFAVALLRSVIACLRNGSSIGWQGVLFWGAMLLMTVAMFSGKHKLLAIGGAMLIPDMIVAIFGSFKNLIEISETYGGLAVVLEYDFRYFLLFFVLLLDNLLYTAGLVLWIMAVLRSNNAKKLSMLAVILMLAGAVIYDLAYIIYGWEWLTFALVASIVGDLLLFAGLRCAPMVLAGHVMQGEAPQSAPAQLAAAATVDPSDRIEKLMKLKALLDAGALTQEEFEEKKKQILGS